MKLLSYTSKLVCLNLIVSACMVPRGGAEEARQTGAGASNAPAKEPGSGGRTRLQAALDSFEQIPHVHEPARRPRVVSEPIEDRRDWVLKVLRQGYLASGHTNRTWDAAAQQSLAAYAEYTRRPSSPWSYSSLTNVVISTAAQGCDDPLIHYMQLRYGLTGSNYTKEAFALDSVGTFRSMLGSQYHPLLKFMAGLRATEAAYAAEPKGNRAPINQLVMACVEDLARDTNAPATDVFECAHLWINFSTGYAWATHVTSQLEGIIKERWGKDERYFELRGSDEIARAWTARGGGFSDKVTPEGWKQFAEHMNEAALALETAWQMNSTNAETAYNMMQVELAQGHGRKRMEKWFNRAMAVAPNYYHAAQLMSFYLEPRWYGSEADAVEFAQSCARSTNWAGTVPLVLADVHRSLAAYYKTTGGPDHWSKPGVWEDVRTSYTKYFNLYPSDYSYRHNFARDAYACGRYAEFLEQTKLFVGGTNFTFFGGEDQFRQMLQRAGSAVGENH